MIGCDIMGKINKLVRDNIPDIIKKDGKKIRFRMLHDQEMPKKLDKKLKEEYDEYKEAFTNDEKIEELVDMVEVIYAISRSLGVSPHEFNERRLKKNKEKGAFFNKWNLLWISDEND